MTTKLTLTALTLALTAASASAQTLGEGGSAAQGSAGPSGAQNANVQLEKCDAAKGTIAVVEPQSHILAGLSRYALNSPAGLLRMMIQQSNCFQVVERGVGMQNMMQERALAAGGQMQSDQNIGKGQMVAADFIVTPSMVFSENNAGGMGGVASQANTAGSVVANAANAADVMVGQDRRRQGPPGARRQRRCAAWERPCAGPIAGQRCLKAGLRLATKAAMPSF